MEEEHDSEICIIHCTYDLTPLVSIKDLVMGNYCECRTNTEISANIKNAEQVGDNVLPNIRCHRKYRQIFTVKSSLEKTMREDKRSEQKLEGENSDNRKSRKV